ncbi:MAG: 3',5'-cyclic nucleotide phosphodiesterase [archaeon]|nr:3',5'-cyclic nucleotide phosphodiesterase [archaeon]
MDLLDFEVDFQTFSNILYSVIHSLDDSLSKEEIQSKYKEVIKELEMKDNYQRPIKFPILKEKISKFMEGSGDKSKKEIMDKLQNFLLMPKTRIYLTLQSISLFLNKFQDKKLVNQMNWAIAEIKKIDKFFASHFDNFKVVEINGGNEMKFLEEYSNDFFSRTKATDLKVLNSEKFKLGTAKKLKRFCSIFVDQRNAAKNFKNILTKDVEEIPMKKFASDKFLSADGRKLSAERRSSDFIEEDDNNNKEKSDQMKAIIDLQTIANNSSKETKEFIIKEDEEGEKEGEEIKEEKKEEKSPEKKEEIKEEKKEEKKEEIINENGEKRSSLVKEGEQIIKKTPVKFAIPNQSSPIQEENKNEKKVEKLTICPPGSPPRASKKRVNEEFDETDINSFHFNIFKFLQNEGRDNVLPRLCFEIILKHGYFEIINKANFHIFINKIRLGYDYLVPYHNDIHATDVLQTAHNIIIHSSIEKDLDLTPYDLTALYIACAVHDFRHPGLNNTYLINSHNKIAIKYNDISVLENFHISSAFKVINERDSNIFVDQKPEVLRIMRKRMIECVLATDMAKHASALEHMKDTIESLKSINEQSGNNQNLLQLHLKTGKEANRFERQQEILNFVIHSSDISNTAKPFSICKEWTRILMDEFFAQGDLEKKEGLPVSFLCDRETTNIPGCQIVFIENVIRPTMNILKIIAPNCEYYCNNLENNIMEWKKIKQCVEANKDYKIFESDQSESEGESSAEMEEEDIK